MNLKLDSLHNQLNQVVDGILVTCVCLLDKAVGNNHADSCGTVSLKTCKTSKGRRLHLEVGDAVALVLK